MKNIVIFASGAGSNARKIMDHFRESDLVQVALIVCNKPEAGVLDIARAEHIPVVMLDKEKFFHTDEYLHILRDLPADLLVLAGFLWKIPDNIVQAYPGRIVNIHPALLPLYGGKGMYGRRVHEAVLAARDRQSGITIHYVNEKYDAGEIILQKTCKVSPDDTPDTLAQKIHLLEHAWYPKVVENILAQQCFE